MRCCRQQARDLEPSPPPCNPSGPAKILARVHEESVTRAQIAKTLNIDASGSSTFLRLRSCGDSGRSAPTAPRFRSASSADQAPNASSSRKSRQRRRRSGRPGFKSHHIGRLLNPCRDRGGPRQVRELVAELLAGSLSSRLQSADRFEGASTRPEFAAARVRLFGRSVHRFFRPQAGIRRILSCFAALGRSSLRPRR